eukprot:8228468-Ditylum_brightwellii.AAC.1
MLDRVVIMDENAVHTNTVTLSSQMPGFPEEACAHTVPEEDHFHVPHKFNFNFTMERNAFTGKVKMKIIKCYGQKRLQKLNMNNHLAAWFHTLYTDKLP